jgi:hypothetical protein
LHQNAGRTIGDLARVFTALLGPFGKSLDVVDMDGFAVLEPQHIFKDHFKSCRQLGKITQTGGLCRCDGVIVYRLASNF